MTLYQFVIIIVAIIILMWFLNRTNIDPSIKSWLNIAIGIAIVIVVIWLLLQVLGVVVPNFYIG